MQNIENLINGNVLFRYEFFRGLLPECRLVVIFARVKGAGDERLRTRLCLGAASPRI
jgi:hypothetical protein